ncbi:MAG: hypothetical protein DCF30_01550 [Hyphomicrobiales bacterium]|nr:MAG: hypothetical protein DCF30_01550 [Hyphomicrobiales bacterium]
MFRKIIITALIVMVSAGSVLAKAPLDAPSRRHDIGMQRLLGEQASPMRALRFKASRPVHLRTAEIERVRCATIA